VVSSEERDSIAVATDHSDIIPPSTDLLEGSVMGGAKIYRSYETIRRRGRSASLLTAVRRRHSYTLRSPFLWHHPDGTHFPGFRSKLFQPSIISYFSHRLSAIQPSIILVYCIALAHPDLVIQRRAGNETPPVPCRCAGTIGPILRRY
jgi:hypothetical protein